MEFLECESFNGDSVVFRLSIAPKDSLSTNLALKKYECVSIIIMAKENDQNFHSKIWIYKAPKRVQYPNECIKLYQKGKNKQKY